ncbi:hypothetical protein A2Z23_02895 [Candidatus Curtissbacteria bacterium RBG_16_39_7]|uniref:Uncharacterized protein n=1 Tax=Candidatus Curtissbacteria bacterium RBG_16_39_7 TaxID=1797707 RepID=A0A1F5G433_9BACT|nr:MAG: hypothetical protein A2Z23_02895 [Candidatus Curtissbacteria bacterium RBG_16_39_7]
MQRPLSVQILAWVYLLVFVAVVFVIFLVHTIPSPFLDIVRLPTFLRLANPFLADSWPTSLHIYQAILVFYLFVTLVDSASLFVFSSNFLREVSAISSYVSFFVIGAVVVFFLYSLLFIGPAGTTFSQQAAFFLGVSFFLFALDLLTFVVDEEQLGKLRLRLRRLTLKKNG